eukprot:1497018-Lingulodinium_polyedra.AAC.1
MQSGAWSPARFRRLVLRRPRPHRSEERHRPLPERPPRKAVLRQGLGRKIRPAEIAPSPKRPPRKA